VEKACRSVLDISDISNWLALYFTLVREYIIVFLLVAEHPTPGFIVKVKKVLECVCVNCGKLKADIVSRINISSTRFVPHYPIFWGLSP